MCSARAMAVTGHTVLDVLGLVVELVRLDTCARQKVGLYQLDKYVPVAFLIGAAMAQKALADKGVGLGYKLPVLQHVLPELVEDLLPRTVRAQTKGVSPD